MAEILIVEDDAPARAVLRDTVELAGYRVREASDGERALRALDDAAVDLVIKTPLLGIGQERREGSAHAVVEHESKRSVLIMIAQEHHLSAEPRVVQKRLGQQELSGFGLGIRWRHPIHAAISHFWCR